MSAPLKDDQVIEGRRWMDLRCSQCDQEMGWIAGSGDCDFMCEYCMEDEAT